MHCTRHRVFLATLIVASKYLNDSSPRNKYWAKFSGVYSVAKVNLMERQLLSLLDYDLRVQESDLLLHLRVFLQPSSLSNNLIIDTLKLPTPQHIQHIHHQRTFTFPNSHTSTTNLTPPLKQNSYPIQRTPVTSSLSIYNTGVNSMSIPAIISSSSNTNNNTPSFESTPSYIEDYHQNMNCDDDMDIDEEENDDYDRNTNTMDELPRSTRDQYGRRLSSTSTCSSGSSSSSIATPVSAQAYQQQQQFQYYQRQQYFLQQSYLPQQQCSFQPSLKSNTPLKDAGVGHFVPSYCGQNLQLVLPPPIPSSTIIQGMIYAPTPQGY